MKVVYKHQAKFIKLNNMCTSEEYLLGDTDINGAVVKLSGRYPESGRVMNTKCKELVYVMSGKGKIVTEDRELKLKSGDMILIEPGEKYFWQGDLTMFVPCTPAWTPEQTQKVK